MQVTTRAQGTSGQPGQHRTGLTSKRLTACHCPSSFLFSCCLIPALSLLGAKPWQTPAPGSAHWDPDLSWGRAPAQLGDALYPHLYPKKIQLPHPNFSKERHLTGWLREFMCSGTSTKDCLQQLDSQEQDRHPNTGGGVLAAFLL